MGKKNIQIKPSENKSTKKNKKNSKETINSINNKNEKKNNKKINISSNKLDNCFNIYLNILESKLITTIEQLELIKTGIINNDNEKKIKIKLLFRASRDGDNNKSYHDKCDGISPTISIIKTKTGYTFGGYTDCSLNSTSGCVKTNNSFIFSFDKMKIYKGVNGGYFHCGTDCGPWFCGCIGVDGDNYFKTENSYQWEINKFKFFEGFTEEYELVGGIRHFSVEEVEVFKVEII